MPDREGPVLVTPEPYYNCIGCKHLKVGSMYPRALAKCLATNGVSMLLDDYPRTPAWCPLLPKETGDGR